MKTRYYVILSALGLVAIFPIISIVFYDTVPVGINTRYFENCEDCELYGCTDDEIYFRGICMTPEAKEKAQSVGETEESTSEPEPEPGPIPDSESLQRQKQQQAKLHVQKVVMTDYRSDEYNIRAINEYRNAFENGYFLEQFIISNKQTYEKNDPILFVFAEWGYLQQECTYPKVEVYLRSYENYDKIKKISEWQKSENECYSISSDSDGHLIVNIRHMPGIFEPYDTCIIPGEYRVIASNLEDESKKAFGYYTCQREKLVGEPQPWMELPE